MRGHVPHQWGLRVKLPIADFTPKTLNPGVQSLVDSQTIGVLKVFITNRTSEDSSLVHRFVTSQRTRVPESGRALVTLERPVVLVLLGVNL